MHQNALIAVAATLGVAAGAGGTYLVTSGPEIEAQSISKAELLAAIFRRSIPLPDPDR